MFELYQDDCLSILPILESGSVDLVLCDPPYGTTAHPWDEVIPLDRMWEQCQRVASSLASFVFTCSQPFTSVLGASNIEMLKYGLIWEKNRATGHVHAKNKPMKKHEDILVFSRGTTVHRTQSTRRMTYNPQGLVELETPFLRIKYGEGDDSVMSARPSHRPSIRTHEGYPTSLVQFDIPGGTKASKDSGTGALHPTQKPVALMEYLIETYSNFGDTVLDFTMGSGTTGVAAANAGRRFIGIEKDEEYFETAKKRIETAYAENEWARLV